VGSNPALDMAACRFLPMLCSPVQAEARDGMILGHGVYQMTREIHTSEVRLNGKTGHKEEVPIRCLSVIVSDTAIILLHFSSTDTKDRVHVQQYDNACTSTDLRSEK
jgi:hypothetical protein